MFLDVLLVLKRNTVRIYKSQIGHAGLELSAQRDRFRGALSKKARQPFETFSAFRHNIQRS